MNEITRSVRRINCNRIIIANAKMKKKKNKSQKQQQLKTMKRMEKEKESRSDANRIHSFIDRELIYRFLFGSNTFFSRYFSPFILLVPSFRVNRHRLQLKASKHSSRQWLAFLPSADRIIRICPQSRMDRKPFRFVCHSTIV